MSDEAGARPEAIVDAAVAYVEHEADAAAAAEVFVVMLASAVLAVAVVAGFLKSASMRF